MLPTGSAERDVSGSALRSLTIVLALSLSIISLAACGDSSSTSCTAGTIGCECDEGGTCTGESACEEGICAPAAGDTDIPESDVDAGVADARLDAELDTHQDSATVELNMCGGTFELTFDGAPAAPSETCGCSGFLVCNGPNALRCVGDRPRNGCGGCQYTPGNPGERCGPCNAGVWTCLDENSMSCVDAKEPNPCGGCGALDCIDCGDTDDPEDLYGRRPAWQCEVEGIEGSYVCLDENSLICLPGGGNACGGTLALPARPGEPCGECGLGTLICDGLDGLVCDESAAPANACGGCAPLAGQPGEACGECGTWTCDDSDPERVFCVEDRNACGGCATLDDAPGEACPNGTLFCAGPDDLACGNGGENACGGTQPLSAIPGTPCGACRDGVFQCAGPDLLQCVGADETNTCGGCGLLPGVAGEICGESSLWTCAEDGRMTCLLVDPRNACGGVSELDNEPGVGCPDDSCTLSHWTCTSEEFLVCTGESNSCGGCVRLVDPDSGEIASPGNPCGTCGTGRLRCNPEDPNLLVCLGDRGSEAFVEVYPDEDEDGAGDRNAEAEAACITDIPPGYVLNRLDCDDSNPAPTGSFCETSGSCGSWVCTDDSMICDSSASPTWFRDADEDGFGDFRASRRECTAPVGYVSNSLDCDDTDNEVNPDGAEIAGDGVDQDCDGFETCYADADGDGARTTDLVASDVFACTEAGTRPAAAPRDCDDADPGISPFAEERIDDGVDQDCDGFELCYLDVDLDGDRSIDETGLSESLDCTEPGFAGSDAAYDLAFVQRVESEHYALTPTRLVTHERGSSSAVITLLSTRLETSVPMPDPIVSVFIESASNGEFVSLGAERERRRIVVRDASSGFETSIDASAGDNFIGDQARALDIGCEGSCVSYAGSDRSLWWSDGSASVEILGHSPHSIVEVEVTDSWVALVRAEPIRPNLYLVERTGDAEFAPYTGSIDTSVVPNPWGASSDSFTEKLHISSDGDHLFALWIPTDGGITARAYQPILIAYDFDASLGEIRPIAERRIPGIDESTDVRYVSMDSYRDLLVVTTADRVIVYRLIGSSFEPVLNRLRSDLEGLQIIDRVTGPMSFPYFMIGEAIFEFRDGD